MKKKKILLNGYIGYGNFGDDLLFQIAVNRFKYFLNVELYVLYMGNQYNPDYLLKMCPDLHLIKTYKTIPIFFYNQFDIVFYIGGGVFFDYSKNISVRTFIKKYISNLLRFRITKLLGTKFGGIGLGIGPYFTEKSQRLHGIIVSSFDFLGVRDQTSYEEALAMGKIDNLYLSEDLSLSLKKEVSLNNIFKSDEIIICPRSYHHKPSYEKHIEELLKFASHIEKHKNITTNWVFLQEESDHLMRKIRSKKFKITIWNPNQMTIEDFFDIFKKAKFTITSRMHSVYVSGMVGTPFIAIELHQKLRFASHLFYDNPIIINPKASYEKYIEACNRIENLSIKKSTLDKELSKVSDLNQKFQTWIEN